ncbi:sensor histidine kinase KdpD [uncultured Alsobacter sp.]|uniref:sensor histidine kinase n=1 Tax=uncultured Alsobacter sp. TaxID=1748258 RepID=UPI0025F327D8|nr:HAMP domain-containing sensor histidine kinase [uncultured Alsobacter sp.]
MLPTTSILAAENWSGAPRHLWNAQKFAFWLQFKESIDDTITKLRTIGVFAIFGHLAYYFIWSDVFPQSYESAPLRIMCAALVATCLFLEKRQERSEFFYYVTYVCIVFNLPFFFFYMMLQNGAAPVWIQSCVCALLYLAWICELRNYLVMLVVGVSAAFGLHAFDPAQGAQAHEWVSSVPVMAFAVAGGLLFRTAETRTIASNRVRSVALASCIAHELRTPLLGTRLDVATASRRIVGLGQAEQDLRQVFARIDHHLLKATHVIDTLLRNVTSERIDPGRFDRHSARAAVEEALARYPFSPKERALVTADVESDFHYWGDDVLLVHALMNLVKNALTSVSAVQRGTVEIRLVNDGQANQIVVRDSGGGIDPRMAGRLFTEFASQTSGGAGLGLLFCRRVARAFGGNIACRSRPGALAEFTITLPPPRVSA